MKMFSAAVIAMSALCVTQAHAQQQPVSTGLGECVGNPPTSSGRQKWS
ncbi:hypothetical protein ABQW55_022910 (plasmid) [Xanthomonas citri pv. malvacearum]|nr:hypothetical protein [Xanthomonas citri]